MSATAGILLGELSNGSYLTLAAAAPGHRPDTVSKYGCSSLEDFEGAISAFITGHCPHGLAGAALSTSGWEVDGQIDLVHYGFTLSRNRIASLLGTPRLSVVNNFVAKALAIPTLLDEERELVCGKNAYPGDIVAVVGPTTGLGCAFLSPNGRGGWVATHCEGGHSDFAPRNDLEFEILKLMMQKHGHVSCERALSAPGLSELWQCLSVLEGDTSTPLSVDEILVQAYVGNDRAKTAIRVQTEIFASVASNFALMTGAKGGVYLGGSHLGSLGGLFDHKVFAERFYDKGRVSSYLRDIPVYKIMTDEPEILGLSTLFDDLVPA